MENKVRLPGSGVLARMRAILGAVFAPHASSPAALQ